MDIAAGKMRGTYVILMLCLAIACCIAILIGEGRPKCRTILRKGIESEAASTLIREIPRTEVPAFVEEWATNGEKPVDEVSRRIYAQHKAWIAGKIETLLQRARPTDAIWLYDTSQRRKFGGDRGLMLLRDCEVVSSTILLIYD